MARAQAVISPTVSPRMRMAVSAAATWAGVGSPRRQAAKKSSASSSDRVAPSARRASSGLKASDIGRQAGARRLHAGEVEEVGQQVVAALGGDGFRVELHAVDRPGPVLHAHDLAVVGPGGDLQVVRQAVALHRQAVVAGGGEGVRQAGEDALAVVVDRAGLAVHQGLGADHLAAKGLADGLVAQADAEDRQVGRRGREQRPGRCRPRWACTGRARAGRASGRRASASATLIASLRMHARLRPQLVQVVDEVVGEAVVVIDHQDHDEVLTAALRPRQYA